MAAVAIGLAWLIAATVCLSRPRLALILMWFWIWLYPNSLLYGTLPLNVRFDDLWVVFMFLLAVFHGMMRGQGINRLTWWALGWAAVLILGNVMGFLITGGAGWENTLKASLKNLYVPMTVFAFTILLTDEESLTTHLKWLLVAATAGGVLGIAMVYLPSQLSMFLIYEVRNIGGQYYTSLEMIEGGAETARRAQGAVGETYLAVTAMGLSLFALCLFLGRIRNPSRLLTGIIAGFLLVTLAYTVTRGAIFGLLAALLWGIFFTRYRWALILLLLAGGVAMVAQGDLLGRVMSRVGGEGGGLTHTLESLLVRMQIWDTFLKNFSPVYIFTGMGMTTVLSLSNATVHNSYLGAFVYGGLLGAFMLIACITMGFLNGVQLRRTGDPLAYAIGTFLIMFTIGLMVYGFVAEIFQGHGSMQLFFAGLVFAERRLLQLRQAGAETRIEPLLQPTAAGYLLANR